MDLAKCSGGKVRVVHVREMSIGKAGPGAKGGHRRGNALVDDAVKALTADGIDATGVVHDSHTGRVASVILAGRSRLRRLGDRHGLDEA